MKKVLILLFVCGINVSVFGQIVRNYSITVNGDTSPLKATVEKKDVVLSFKKSDVITITFHELTEISQKAIKITSDSRNNDILIGTFNRNDIKDDQSYALNISFDNLNLNEGSNHIYSIKITDKKGKQNLLRFKLE